MRVIILQHGMFPGFVSPIPKECAQNLFRLGVDVSVVTIGSRSELSNGEAFKFPVHCIENSSLVRTYSKLKELFAECDLVHYFPGKGLELMPFLNRRVKYIFNHISVSVTGNDARDKLINSIKRLQPFFADLVLGTDEPLLKALRPVLATPVEVMPVGYSQDLFFPCPPRAQTSEKVLIYHGAVRPQRRLDRLIEVLARLPSNYKLTIIGGGTAGDEEYRAYLGTVGKRLNCSDRLELTNMAQPEIREAIGGAYMGLSYVPAIECFQDQFVLKTLEYLACHRPVLTTTTRYNKQFNDAIGPNRILLADDTLEDIAEKILNADDYVEAFYAEENLSTLTDALAPYSSRQLVQTKLLPIYQRLLSN